MTATIVTVTHQSEEIFVDTLRKYDFAEAQFRSTRDAMLQLVLRHPVGRHAVAARAPPLPDDAALQVQGAPPNPARVGAGLLDFRTSGEWEIVVQNVNQLKLSELPAVEGNPASTQSS